MVSKFLEKIVEHKRAHNKKKKEYFATLKEKVSGEKFTRYGLFRNAISSPGQINLIAEIKKASPSQGLIRNDFDLMSIADIYVKNGAAALSILTEEKFFLGKPPYVSRVSENYSIPILTKDFILDEGQIYETFSMGASAILLIAAILSDAELKHLMNIAAQFDLDCLVEVHNEAELERALKTGANIIGINNRNLHTFDVDLAVSGSLIPKVPQDKIIVAESGISSHEQIKQYQDLGAHAVLIGETFMRETDIGKKVQEIMHGSG